LFALSSVFQILLNLPWRSCTLGHNHSQFPSPFLPHYSPSGLRVVVCAYLQKAVSTTDYIYLFCLRNLYALVNNSAFVSKVVWINEDLTWLDPFRSFQWRLVNSDYTYSEPPKALFMLFHVFCCAHHLHRLLQSFTWFLVVTPLWPPEGLRHRLVARCRKRLCTTVLYVYNFASFQVGIFLKVIDVKNFFTFWRLFCCKTFWWISLEIAVWLCRKNPVLIDCWERPVETLSRHNQRFWSIWLRLL